MWLGIIIGASIFSLLYGAWAIRSILAAPAGDKRMGEIARAIQEGANAYLSRQYKTIAFVGVPVFIVAFLVLGIWAAIGFLLGAVFSGVAGFIGMLVSVRANVRTTEASRSSLGDGLGVAFKSGAITGMLVVGLALLGLVVYYWVLTGPLELAPNDRTVIDALVALGFGASLISIFARLGGGIFTRARMLAAIWSARSKRVSLRMIHATLQPLRTMLAIMLAIALVWRLTCLKPMR